MPPKSWWARLPFALRMATGATALLALTGVSAAGVVALLADEPPTADTAGALVSSAPRPAPVVPPALPDKRRTAGPQTTADRNSGKADRTRARAPRAVKTRTDRAPAPVATSPAPARELPAVTARTVIQLRSIPYGLRLVADPELPPGRTEIRSDGAPGRQRARYLVTYADGKETGRRLLDATVTREPQDRVVALGTDGSDACFDEPELCLPTGRSEDVDAP